MLHGSGISPLIASLLLTAAAAGQTVTAVRTDSAPVIDGVPDEEVWNLAVPVTEDFIQQRPDCGDPMSEPTEIRILYDDRAIYIGLTMHDSHPEQFTRVVSPRDTDVMSEWIGIWLDTFNDDNNCYMFFISVENVQQDGRLCEVSGWDISWDAVWESRTATSEDGWTVEVAIPFSAIRFPGSAEQVWGINFKRTISRTNESAYLYRMADNGEVRIRDFGNLHGLHDLPASRQIEFRPYGAARFMHLPDEEDEWDPWASTGLDLRMGISSDVVLDLTINPDFGQVEADPDEVNLSHWESFLREKRPFFLEGADLFSMPFMMFYSRRIGAIADNGEIIPILGGAKLTGAAAGFRFGVLNAWTGRVSEDDELREPGTNYAAARIVREFGNGTYIGFSATSVDIPDQSDTVYTYGRSGAVEGQLRFLENHTIHAAAGGTWNSADSIWKDNFAWRGWYSFENDRWEVDAGFVYREQDYNANMIGYTSSTGEVSSWVEAGVFHPFDDNEVIEHTWVNLNGYYDQVPDGPVTGRGLYLNSGVVFRNRYHIDLDISWDGDFFDRYEGPEGSEYNGGFGWGASGSLDSRRKFYAMAWAGGGNWFEGTSLRLGSWINYKPAPYVSLGADMSWRTTGDARMYNWDIEEWDRRDTDWRSVELSGTWMFSNTLSLRLTSQVSRFEAAWGGTGTESSNGHWMNLLLGWSFRPGSMFYLMVGENAEPDEDGSYSDPELTVYSKLTWFLPL
jgi:hypothetical protein